VDDRPRLRRWVVGDHVVTSDVLGGSLVLGGVSVSREFALDPYVARFPTVGLSGAALTPSTADVYVNGVLIRREDLPPGPFDLRNLPVPTGSASAKVVLRDAFGREREISSTFYIASTVLARGVQDYSYTLGFQRDNLGTESGDYGRLGFLGMHRLGVTDWLTPGLRLELGTELASGGPVLALRLPFGEVELAAAGSREKARLGTAASVAYLYSARPISFGLSLQARSDQYATLSLRAADDRPRLDTSGFVGTELGSRATVTVQYRRLDARDRGLEERVSTFWTVRLGPRTSLFLTGAHTREPGHAHGWEGSAGLTYAFGERTIASVSYERRGDQGTATAQIQQSLPLGTGWGYRLQASAGDDDFHQGNGLLQYQGPWGRYEASYQRQDGHDGTSLSVAGGVVLIGGGVHLTRPVEDSFALIRVSGVEGVRGYLSNQEVGRTNARGELLVPNLLPYYGNRIGISDQDIPLDYTVGATERVVASPLRGGAVVAFPVKPIRAIIGRLLVERAGGVAPPAYGQLSVTADGEPFESPIGEEGEFYLDGLPPGRHPAVITHPTLGCRFTLEVPGEAPPILDVGAVTCVAP
jgi:outer membrane usher protein